MEYPFPAVPYGSSSNSRVDRFAKVLMEYGFTTIVRRICGDDIDAACGQLAGEVIDRTKRTLKKRKGPGKISIYGRGMNSIALFLPSNRLLGAPIASIRIIINVGMNLRMLRGVLVASLLAGYSGSLPEKDALSSDTSQTRLLLGLEYLQQGDMNAARKNLEKSLAASPQDYRTQLGMALYEQQIGENALAEQRYQHILKLALGNGTVLNNYGALLCSLGQYIAAQQQFIAVVQVSDYGRIADSLENAGYCFLKAGKNDQARPLLTRAMKVDLDKGTPTVSGSRKAIGRREAHTVATFIRYLSTCVAGQCQQLMVTDPFRRISRAL